MPLDTVAAITARMLELGRDLAFQVEMSGDTADTLEFRDLDAQLERAKAREEAGQ